MGYGLCYIYQMKGSCKIDIPNGLQVSDRFRISSKWFGNFLYSYTQRIKYEIFMFKVNMEKLYA